MSQVNLNISIENNEIKINDIPVATIAYVNNEIQKIELLNSIQQSVFQPYNGVILSSMFPENLNGVYIQLPEQKKIVATSDTVRFYSGTHYSYLRNDGNYYYLLVYVEPATSKVFGNISLSSPAWLVLQYLQDPTNITENINHYVYLSATPVQAFVSNETSKFGSQTFPNNPHQAEFF